MRSKSKRQEDFFDTCTQCKTSWSCCHETTPPITEKRKRITEAYLKKNRVNIEEPFVRTDYVFPRLDRDGYCVFHDKSTKKCLIHLVKPETCVAGPITFDLNKKTEKIEWFIKMEIICPLAGRVHENKALCRKHIESAKRELLRLIDDLDPKALKAVLRKDEPETFKIAEDKIGKKFLKKLA